MLLTILVGVCGALPIRSISASPRAAISVSAPQWSDRLRWAGLAFVPSGLLVAFTSYLTADIASVPLLWVIPLALFLATFILVFREDTVIPHRLMLIVQPLLVAGTLVGLSVPGGGGWLLAVVTGFAAFVVTCLLCHRELYACRPDHRHLTGFYVWMSLGGVIGGVFSAILAPQAFDAVYELPILFILGLACRPGFAAALADRREAAAVSRVPVLLLALVAVMAIGLALLRLPDLLYRVAVMLPLAIASLLMLANREQPLRLVSYAVVAGLSLVSLPSAFSRGHSERSFFGMHRVYLDPSGSVRVLMHGTTIHGAERIKDKLGNPVTSPIPSTYFYPGSPLARGVATARQVSAKLASGFAVGIVGLGAGSMSCYSRPDETWRFYEIDPLVVRIARDERLFTFLTSCRPRADIVLGDARLTLAKEPTGRFDYLVLDAFSSDAIPVHLLTREAIAMYLDKLAPHGILALHISNRHLHLQGVAAATVLSLPGTFAALVIDRPPADSDGAPSDVMFVTKSATALAPILAWSDSGQITEADTAAWTDDYSDVLSAMWRRYFH